VSATVSHRLPLGVGIIAMLIGIFGFFLLAVGLLVALLGLSVGVTAGGSVFGFTGTISGVITLLIGGVILAVATGLWDQELWVLDLAILALLFYGLIAFVSGSWLTLAVVLGLLVYLVAVSDQFY
jgi:hypothetical protein